MVLVVLASSNSKKKGDTVSVADAGGDKKTNNILIRGNGNDIIQSGTTDASFNTNNKETSLYGTEVFGQWLIKE